MKKLLGVLSTLLILSTLFTACPDNTGNGTNTTEPETPEIPEVVPDNAFRNWTAELDEETDEWVVVGVEDLQKLIEVVNLGNANGGSSLLDETICLENDIVINKNVLTSDLLEPAEDGPGVANSGLINLDSIGRCYNSEKDFDAAENAGLSGNMPFQGEFDGQGHSISGWYSYQGHQGLGVFGCVDGATIKNLIVLDTSIINMNIWTATGSHDGSDDDRFGGLVGLVPEGSQGVTIENCMFVGVVGSAAAFARDSMYEYIGGLIGRSYPKDGVSTAENCFVCAKVYGDGNVLVGKEAAVGDVVLYKTEEGTDTVEGVELNAENFARVEEEIAKIKERL